MSSAEQRKAETFFQYGSDAVQKNNYDYAIQMYREACKLVPTSLPYRQALRHAQRKKFGNDATKVSHIAMARNQPIKLRARASKSKGNWTYVLELLEEAFVNNPWDIGASMDAAEACENLGAHDVAQWLLESVSQQAGDDVKFLRFLAIVYENNENFQKSINCWERVKKLDPSDEDAIRKINGLSASATIARSGLGEAISRQQPGELMSTADAEEYKYQALSPEERLLRDIQKEPDQVRAYLELADYYRGQLKLEDAEKILSKARKQFPEDEVVHLEYAEIQISRLRQAIDTWARRVQTHPDDEEAPGKLEKLKSMLRDYEIKEFKRRLKNRPDDARLAFQLGQRYAEAERHDEAIAMFQQARNSPEYKVRALVEAGLSFEANGVLKLAERSFQEALKHANAEDSTVMNDIHYNLGRIAESMGNHVLAEEHYNEVAANDYSYRDVAQRLKNLNRRPAT